jgi:hypothetical protein
MCLGPPRRSSPAPKPVRDSPFDLMVCGPARYTSHDTHALHPIPIVLAHHSRLGSGDNRGETGPGTEKGCKCPSYSPDQRRRKSHSILSGLRLRVSTVATTYFGLTPMQSRLAIGMGLNPQVLRYSQRLRVCGEAAQSVRVRVGLERRRVCRYQPPVDPPVKPGATSGNGLACRAFF